MENTNAVTKVEEKRNWEEALNKNLGLLQW